MSHPRAQRTVAPSHLVRPGAIPHIGSNDACILFAYAILAREAAMLADYRPQGENAPTAHAIHQLRVAARRLRVALRLFRRMLPSKAAAHLLAELRWFARSLGELRDLDVYAQAFKAYAQSLPPERRAQLSGYELFLRRERAAASSDVAEEKDSGFRFTNDASLRFAIGGQSPCSGTGENTAGQHAAEPAIAAWRQPGLPASSVLCSLGIEVV